MDFSRYEGLRRCALLAALALGAIAGLPALAHADDNPGYDRPGLGFTPAVLGAGDVTLEQGLPDWSRGQGGGIGSSQYTADTLLRVGLGGPLELQLGSSYNRLHPLPTHSGARYGRGDSSVAMKFALPASGAFSWGLPGSVEFTDGARDFRNDQRQYLLGADFNWQLDPRNALSMYLQNVRAGGRDSTLLALNASHALTSTLNGYVELAQQHDANTGTGSMAGAGLAWQVTPRVQLDGSVRHRLAGHADTWEAGIGVSVYFGR
ncbi:transporter [Rhodanobacter sp. 115]|uniref:transporter n=1 Tax=Rhodanobacter sp. FW021-MT20 TaxID=1162282 RepID=UPI0009DA8048|nr:transporter [Rhodanobacter sp. 115]